MKSASLDNTPTSSVPSCSACVFPEASAALSVCLAPESTAASMELEEGKTSSSDDGPPPPLFFKAAAADDDHHHMNLLHQILTEALTLIQEDSIVLFGDEDEGDGN